jgi:hypothetical protein
VATGSGGREARGSCRRKKGSIARRRPAASAVETRGKLGGLLEFCGGRELVAVVWRESWRRGAAAPVGR